MGKMKVRRPKAIGSPSMQMARQSMNAQKPKLLTGQNTKIPAPPKLMTPKLKGPPKKKLPMQKPPKPIGGKR